MAPEIGDKCDVECNFYKLTEDVPDPKELSSEKWNVMIFGDLLLENQQTCESYYVRGRHSNVDCCYLAQYYFKLSCQTIRENANFKCLFPQDLKKLNYIFEDHMRSDMTKDDFRQLCKAAWEKQHGFVIVDLSSKKHNGRYRSGLDEFYTRC